MLKKAKKSFILACGFLFSTAVSAQWLMNPLIGGSIGYGQRGGNVSYFIWDSAVGKTAFFGLNEKNNAWLEGFLVGYQGRCNRWLVGGEINIDWLNNKETNHAQFSQMLISTELTQKGMIALTGRIGYQIAAFFLPYVKAGIETTRETLNESVFIAQRGVLNLSGSNWTYYFVGGVGVEMPIPMWLGFSFRLEYDYHAKGKAASAQALFDTVVVQVDSKPVANTGKLSLVYHFL